MMCETAKEKLVDKFYGDIVPKDLRQLEHHLASCSACQEEERALRMDLAQVLPLHSIDVARVMPDLSRAVHPQAVTAVGGWWARFLVAPIPVYQVVLTIGLLVVGWTAGLWAMSGLMPRTVVSVRQPHMYGGMAVYQFPVKGDRDGAEEGATHESY